MEPEIPLATAASRSRPDGRAAIAAAVVLAMSALTGCGRPAPEAPAPAEPPIPEETPTAEAVQATRPALRDLPVPPAFAQAVEAGTRTMDGRPGPAYWQQRVSYHISAELDPGTGRLSGEERVLYHNRSPDTLEILVFHLYQNVFREGEPRTRRMPITGGVTLERIAVDGREAVPFEGVRPPPGRPVYQEDGTLMALGLPRPLAPGDSAAIDIAWRFTVPPEGAPRIGRIGTELYTIAQWYPQVATYDDLDGWHTWPYLGDGEFYLEYGDFDVSLTLPEGWLVAATGTLENPGEVLAEPVLERLDRAWRERDVVNVVTEAELGDGGPTRRVPGERLTWRFRAEDVRDFAFAASDRYLWDATHAVTPDADGDGRPDTVAVHALYRPEASTWREAARYTRHATEFHAERWHPYVYPQITSVEGPVGGMEYPMIVFVRAFPDARLLYTVINHEVAHEWYPMFVGSNEAAFAWQDEGLATYIENLATMDFFPDADPFASEIDEYLAIAGTGAERPMMRHADLYGPGPARVIASYRKPGFMLRALGEVIGPATLREGLAAYTRRWLFRHPHPLDFFHTIEDIAERELDWFFYPWWYETGVLDQAIADVAIEPADGGERVTVTIEDRGDHPMPVPLVLTTAAGERRTVEVPADVWLRGARAHETTVTVPGRLERVEIDPERIFPDVDRSDNVWRRAGGSGR